jgi:hypothetical protein
MSVKQMTKYYIGFLKKLNRIDDSELRTLCGTDVVLYMTFLRYSAYLFGLSK